MQHTMLMIVGTSFGVSGCVWTCVHVSTVFAGKWEELCGFGALVQVHIYVFMV